MDHPEKPAQKPEDEDAKAPLGERQEDNPGGESGGGGRGGGAPPEWDEELLELDPEDPSDDEELWDDDDSGGDDWEDEELLADPGDDRWDLTEAEWSAAPAPAGHVGGDRGGQGDAAPRAWDEDLGWTEDEQVEEEPTDDLAELVDSRPLEAPVIIGWSPRVDFPRWGIADIPARCSTDLAASSLRVEVRPGDEGAVLLVLQGQEIAVPVTERDGDLVVRMTLLVAAKTFPVDLRLRATSGAPLVVLGRDALAGRFLVDVSR